MWVSLGSVTAAYGLPPNRLSNGRKTLKMSRKMPGGD
jgi:hypothetical protein